MQPLVIPGDNPGEVIIPSLNRSFQQVQLTEDDVMDSEEMASGSITADRKIKLFDDMSSKNEQHATLVSQNHKLLAGDEAAVFRIGFYMRTSVGQTIPHTNDFKKVYENGMLEVKFNRRTITQGPLFKYPSGYGIYGSTTQNDASLVSLGVPNVAGAPILFVPQQLKHTDEVYTEVRFPSADWLTSTVFGTYTVASLTVSVVFTVLMRVVLTSPLGK